MSRTTNVSTGPVNPSTRWFEYSAGDGTISYYDKEARKKVVVDLPFKFAVLDELKTVTGWHDKSQSGIYANEVRNTSKDELEVKSFKGGPLLRGFYKDVKDRLKLMGGKFTTSLYIAYDDNGTIRTGNLRVTGAALRAWSDFAANNNKYGGLVVIAGTEDQKTGSVRYKTPVFALDPIPDHWEEAAVAADAVLQEFLTARLASDKAAIYAKDQADDANIPFAA